MNSIQEYVLHIGDSVVKTDRDPSVPELTICMGKQTVRYGVHDRGYKEGSQGRCLMEGLREGL